MNEIKVFGHKNPDMDTVASAYAASYMLKNRDDKNYVPYLLGSVNKEVKYVIDTYNIDLGMKLLESVKDGEEVVLVDHNEETQSVNNISNAVIKTVIDHHKIDFKTAYPLEYIAKPVGCTCTIIYSMLKEMNKLDNMNVNILMLSAILSDTLILKSPTTTDLDRKTVEELSKITNIDYNEHGFKMLSAGADLSDLSKEELITIDSKMFETNRS